MKRLEPYYVLLVKHNNEPQKVIQDESLEDKLDELHRQQEEIDELDKLEREIGIENYEEIIKRPLRSWKPSVEEKKAIPKKKIELESIEDLKKRNHRLVEENEILKQRVDRLSTLNGMKAIINMKEREIEKKMNKLKSKIEDIKSVRKGLEGLEDLEESEEEEEEEKVDSEPKEELLVKKRKIV
jgi:hypothetical protein